MNTNLFLVYILTLTSAITYFYVEAREYFSPVKHLSKKISHLENKLQEEKFKNLLTSYEFHDFRAYVGTLIPKALEETGYQKKFNQEKSYPIRSLASVTQKRTNENLAVSRANLVFEEGKKYFREQKYEAAVNSFKNLVEKHPYSAHVPESMFLLVESHFVLRNYDQSVYYANKMLDIYPDSELTGYALVRLGKVYEFQDRYTDAIDIYKTVIKSFPDRGIASLAENSLQAIEL